MDGHGEEGLALLKTEVTAASHNPPPHTNMAGYQPTPSSAPQQHNNTLSDSGRALSL